MLHFVKLDYLSMGSQNSKVLMAGYLHSNMHYWCDIGTACLVIIFMTACCHAFLVTYRLAYEE